LSIKILISLTSWSSFRIHAPQHKTACVPFFTPSQLCRTNVVQNPWDRHGTKRVDYLERSHLYSPCNTGTCIMKVTLRVVSNLSFTATLSKHKPPTFLEKVGGLWFQAWSKGLRLCSAHSIKARIDGPNAYPSSVNSYSTFGGTCG
jgi:hypothetical protein